MIDERELLERAARRFSAEAGIVERVYRRRDRKRRNQRITAGVVAIVVFVAAIWIVTDVASLHRTQAPLVPGGSGTTSPARTPSPSTERVGFIGLPPEGATQSTPEAGELVLRARGRCSPGGYLCQVFAYADGRLIWVKAGDDLPFGATGFTTGLLEQRLTPAGIELLRSRFGSTGSCSRAGDPDTLECMPPIPGAAPFPAIPHPGWEDARWGLPAGAWDESEIRPYVPSEYAICFWPLPGSRASRLVGLLPAQAGDLLRGTERTFDFDNECFAATTDEARQVNEILAGAGFDPVEDDEHLAYHIEAPYAIGDVNRISFEPILPHGDWTCLGCG